MTQKEQLPNYNGVSAFDGALRFHDPDDISWKKKWGELYGKYIPEIKIFASDAFGNIYGLDDHNHVAIFWMETAETEHLNIEVEDFYEMILEDPIQTINFDLYQDAVERYGEITLNENFAFKIEISLGGSLSVDNIVVMNIDDHYRSLAKIANQIKNMPIGSSINPVIEK